MQILLQRVAPAICWFLCASWAFGESAPTAPRALWVDAKTDTSLTISWTGATDADNNITSYRLYRGTTLIASPTAASYTDMGLNPTTTYSYKVITADGAGLLSPESLVLTSVTFAPGVVAPPMPTGIVVASTSPATVGLQWTPVAHTVPIERYIVTALAPIGSSIVRETPSASITLVGLRSDQTYNIRVIAIDQMGNPSPAGSLSGVTVPTDAIPPTVPTNLVVTDLTHRSFTLSWTPSSDNVGVTEYAVVALPQFPSTDPSFSFKRSQTTCFFGQNPDALIKPGVTYQILVSAMQADPTASQSESAVITVSVPADPEPQLRPTTPVLTALSFTQFSVTTSGSGDPGSIVAWQFSRNGTGEGITPAAGGGGAAQYQWSDLEPGTTHRIAVRGQTSAGIWTNYSDELLVVLLSETNAPLAPNDLRVVSRTINSLDLAWTTGGDIGGSGIRTVRIERDGLLIGESDEGTFADTGLSEGPHVYVLRSVDRCGNVSPPSQPRTIVMLVDSVAPTIPAQPNASSITKTAVVLTWIASSDGVGVDGYEIFRNGTRVALSTLPTWVDSGRIPGSTELYTIRAFDRAGNRSLSSAERSVTFLADNVPPTVPSQPLNGGATVTSIRLTWTASTDDDAIAGYEVLRGGAPIAIVPDISYVDGGLTSGTAYVYTVKAIDRAGNRSAASASRSASTLNDVVPPTTPQAPWLTSNTATSISIAWLAVTDNVGVTSYDIFRNSVLVGNVTSLTYTDLGLPANATNTYTIKAVDAVGNRSSASAGVVMTTRPDIDIPTPPTNLTVTARTDATVSLTWTAGTDNGGSGIVLYRLFRGATEIGTATGLNFVATGLAAGTAHSFTVKTQDGAGNLSISSVARVTSTLVDATAPTAPTGLTATGVTPTTVTLSWTASTDATGVIAYEVLVGGTWTIRTTTTTATIGGLTPGVACVLSVRAVDEAGNRSTASVNQVVSTTADSVAPTVPGSLLSPSKTATSINLTWTASTDNATLLGYEVVRDGVVVASPVGLSFSDSGLAPNISYAYALRAVDVAGNRSAATAALTVTTSADTVVPTAPQAVVVTAIGLSTVSLSWIGAIDNVGVTGYQILRGGAQVGMVPVTTFTDTSLLPGTAYAYQVRAFDAAGKLSALTVAVSATTAADVAPPTAPTNLLRTAKTATSISLSWTAGTDAGGSGIASYDILRDNILIGTNATTTYADAGLTANTAYLYTVKTVDKGGNRSSPSLGYSMMTNTDTTAPTQPAGLSSPAKTATSVNLSWAASTDAVGVTGYEVRRGSTVVMIVPGTTATDTGLIPNTAYSYTIVARDAGANRSSASSALSVTTATDVVAPTIPTALISPAKTATAVSLSWSASSDMVGMSGYQVLRAGTLIATIPGTNYIDSSRAPNTAYSYTIRAQDLAGNLSAATPSLSVTTAADTIAPSGGSGPAITGKTTTLVSLAWLASTDNVAVTGYEIFRNGSLLSTVTGLTYTATGLVPGTTSTFTLQAKDAAGNRSTVSSPLSVTTIADTIVPTSPTNLQVTATTDTTIAVSWTAAADPGGSGVTAYEVRTGSTVLATSSTTTATVTGRTPNTSTTLTVRAIDAAGNASANGLPLTIRTKLDGVVPAVPTALTSPSKTSVSVSLGWTAATDNIAVTGYDIFRSSVLVTSTVTAATTTTITGLTPNTANSFTVRARDAAGNLSAASAALSVTTSADTIAPSKPGSLASPSKTDRTVSLTWTASTDASGIASYSVYRGSTLVGTVTTGTAFTDSGLNPSGAYSYTIKAKDRANNVSAASTAKSVTTNPDTSAPQAPGTLVASNVTPSSVTLQWSMGWDNHLISHYRIYENGALVGLVYAPVTSWVHTGLVSGSSHAYTVRTFDAGGNSSGDSPIAMVVTPGDSEPPTVPAEVAQVGLQNDAVTIVWSASTDGDGTGVALYEMSENGIATATTTTTSATFSSLNGPTTITIRAKDGAGNWSAASVPIRVAIVDDLNAPSVPAAPNAVATGPHTVVLTWPAATDDRGVVGYKIYRYYYPVEYGMIGESTSTTFTDVTAVSGSQRNYSVRAVDAAGNESALSYGTIITPIRDTVPPTAPPAVRVVRQSAQAIEIAWDASTDDFGIRGYKVSNHYAEFPVNQRRAIISRVNNSQVDIPVTAMDFASNSATTYLRVPTIPDTQLPTTPARLFIQAQTRTSVTLQVSAASDNVGVVQYRWQLDDNPPVTTGLLNWMVKRNWTANQLIPGSAHYASVIAIDGAGNESLMAATLNFVQPSDTIAPPAPTPAWISARTDTSVTIDYVGVIDDDGISVPKYEFTKDGQPWSMNWPQNLTPNTTYVFTVAAVDAAGNRSPAVTTKGRTLPRFTTAPKDVRVASFTESSLTLAWSAPDDVVGLSYYKIYYNGEAFGYPVAATGPLTTTITGIDTTVPSSWYIGGQDSSGRLTATAGVTLRTPARSLLASPPNFDAALWVGDANYRTLYLSTVDPARVWGSATPGAAIPSLRATSARRQSISAGGTVTLSVTGAASAPVTFVCTGFGSFTANLGNVITVLADTAGIASVTYKSASAGRTPILAASPLATGTVRFLVQVTP